LTAGLEVPTGGGGKPRPCSCPGRTPKDACLRWLQADQPYRDDYIMPDIFPPPHLLSTVFFLDRVATAAFHSNQLELGLDGPV